MGRQICAAIKSRHDLVFNYDGLPRGVEPHAHGISQGARKSCGASKLADKAQAGHSAGAYGTLRR